ncbi:pheromone receptor [Plectosphaerella plurivora]|uniref:Pheromone receptor n=1 Tax=Plectosphaerella plurivora TaxID=936078 RepID=A0A9P8VFK7_9PEZI|nr:pheromone receptor [Plectosphaerella plurivora]
MSDFDPRKQVFYLIAADGETQVPVSLEDFATMQVFDITNGIHFGAQAGASIMLFFVALCLMPRFKLVKLSQWLQLSALVLNIARLILFAAFYTSPWNDPFAVWSGDYSHITSADITRNAASETLSLVIGILIQVILFVQAWAMLNLLSRRWKWTLAAISFLISLNVITFRFISGVVRIQSIITLNRVRPAHLAFTFIAYGWTQIASIIWYCVLFNSKLALHLIKHRGVLPSRHGLSAIEVLVITNGLLMFFPVVFSCLAFNDAISRRIEVASATQTLVILILILGTLIAQRVCSPNAAHTRRIDDTGSSGAAFKYGTGSSAGSAYPGGHRIPSTVTSHVEASPRSRDPATDSIEAELREIDSTDDAEKAGVRVNQEFERRVERA